MSDHLASLGSLGFTYRTRRLADRLAEAGRRIYERADLPLEPYWHALLLYLDGHGAVTVTEAAAALQVSHPAVVEMARRMGAVGLIEARADPRDGRRRILELSEQGRRSMPGFKATWATIVDELDELIERTSGGDALACLGTMEAALDEQELDVRVGRRVERGAERDLRSTETSAPASAQPVVIRETHEQDRDAVLHVARELVRAADTYAYDPGIDDHDLWHYWFPADSGQGFVAELEGAVAGMFVIRPNNPGPGRHVANASYAVRADMRGLGLGRRMGQASLELARELGYRAMQFNTVVSTNTGAIRLWRSLGFRTVGTVPEGFRLPDGTYVAHHIMFRALA